MKVCAVIQARMSSERLQGKVLQKVRGKALIEYLVERLERSRQIGGIIVATSTAESDWPIVRYCNERNLRCVRGSLDNVAARFLSVTREVAFDAFVRINADSPLMDPELVDEAILIFADGDYDLVTNVLERTFPKGMSVEVIRSNAFVNFYPEFRTPQEFEHVTPFFYTHSSRFKIFNFQASADYSNIRLCVDTQEDLDRFAKIVDQMKNPPVGYDWQEILTIYEALFHPSTTCLS